MTPDITTLTDEELIEYMLDLQDEMRYSYENHYHDIGDQFCCDRDAAKDELLRRLAKETE